MRYADLARAALAGAATMTLACGCAGSAPKEADVSVPPVTAEVATPSAYRLPATVDPVLLPPLTADTTRHVDLVLLDKTVMIAPGIPYRGWTFNGTVPGPVIHARVGDTIDITLTNHAAIGHSIDFHAALAPPDVAYETVPPGKTLHFAWVARYPGAFLYHCGTPPVLAHISNGMYGAIIIDPPGGWGPPAQEFVLVQSEFYPEKAPNSSEYYGDLADMKKGLPTVVTFNGMAFRYRTSPLPIDVGKLVRVFVVNAGPSHFSAFHVVGTLFKRVYADGNPANLSVGIQTASIPPGGGAVVEFAVQQAGIYPVVTHSFGDADNGAIGLFKASGS